MWCFNLLADVTVIVMECILNQTVNLPGLAYIKKTVYTVAVCVFCSCQVYPITFTYILGLHCSIVMWSGMKF